MRSWFGFWQTRGIPPKSRANYFAELQHYALWVILAGAIDMNLNGIVAKKTFGAPDYLTTLIWAMPVLSNILNVMWGVLCRGRRRIPLMVLVSAGVTACVASIALVPRTLQPWAGWIFLVQLAATFFLWSGLITLRVSIWQVNYPGAQRAQIAGRFQILRIAGMVVVPISLAALFDAYPDAYHYTYPAAALIGLLSLIPLRRIRVAEEDAEIATVRAHLAEHGHGEKHTLGGYFKGVGEALRIFRDDRGYRNYQVAQFLLGSANFFTEPILILVLTTELDFGYFHSTLIMTLIRAFVNLAATPSWSRFFDRVGIFRFRIYNSAFWCVSYVFVTAAMVVWTFGGHGYAGVVIALIVIGRLANGMGAAGGMIAWPLGHLAFARPHQENLYLGVHVALTGVRGLVMPQLALLLRLAFGNLAFGTALVLATTAHILFRRMRHLDKQLEANAERSTEGEDGRRADTLG